MGSAYNPLQAPEYIAGTITVSGGQIGVPQNLLALAIAQLEPNTPGAGLYFNLQADSANTVSVKIGCPTKIAGALSDTNYGFELVPGGSSYRNSSGGGISAPIGPIQIFASAAATLHLELWA
ncbi:MAG TPA: hypothetical protein VEL77_15220 [Rugosimonospora sp.]|nr:hypothetical protein [Rugosimonospora sp.]